MRKKHVAGDVDLRGFLWSPAGIEPAWDVAVQRASADVAGREREHTAACAEREAIRGDYLEQVQALASAAGIDPVRQRHALAYISRTLERLELQQRAVEASAAILREARCAHIAAQRRLDSLLHLEADATALYVAQQRRRAGKEADHAWLAALTRVRRDRLEGNKG